MKNLRSLGLAAVIAAMAFTTTSALAQPYPAHPPGPPPGYYHPPGQPHGPPPPGWHQWHQGDHYHGNRYVVHNYSYYRLRPPPPGYQWVQNGGQFVMIAVATGLVTEIIVNSQYQ